MTPEVRRKALATAAKTAMVMTFGCSPPPPHPEAATTTASAKAEAPAASCTAYLAGLQVVDFEKLAPDDPLRSDREKGRGVYEAFADRAARSNPRTQQCCTEALTGKGAQAPQRFACCSVLDMAHQPPAIQMACTPWGPPWPPEMA